MDDTDQHWSQQCFSRKQALTAGTRIIATGLAGCTSSSSTGDDVGSTDSGNEAESNDDTSGDGRAVAVASFFSFYDFACNIVYGTPVQVGNLIPTGLHGHGWQPNANVTKDIIEADAFIHVGPGFQP